jgi:hypothetical protein
LIFFCEDAENRVGGTERSFKMATIVRVRNGNVEEYENGVKVRTYGSNIRAASTDGTLVAAVTNDGRVEEYVKGAKVRTYGSNAVNVQVSGGTVAISLSNGRTEEYVNGGKRRSY